MLSPLALAAEINVKKWDKVCDKEGKSCFIAIKAEIAKKDTDQKQTIATSYIKLGTTTERKMDLISGEEKTYKLKEESKAVPILILHLPLNTDLAKKPLIQIDDKSIVNLNYTHCNQSIGCNANSIINNEAIKFFKTGKELTVTFGAKGAKTNMSVKFPLKNFTKSYESLPQ